jgi:hypothetical protein
VEISYKRVLRITLSLGAVGALAVLVRWGWRDALGFVVGSALSYWSFLNFVKLAETVGWSGKAPAKGSAGFFALRYLLIGGAIYVMIRYLGSTPGVLIVGLLTSFAALVLELLWGALGSR